MQNLLRSFHSLRGTSLRAAPCKGVSEINMDAEILKTLQEIRGILFLLTSAVCFVVLILFLRNLGRAFVYLKSAKDNAFINEAERLFDLKEYAEVVSISERKLKQLPDHSHAVWWMAKAKFRMGQEQEAGILFEKLIELEPSWEENYIQPYIKKISVRNDH